MKFAALTVIVLLTILSSTTFGQEFPDKIRGYRVYIAKIRVETSERSKNQAPGQAEATIILGEPEIVDLGLSGITFEVGAELGSFDRSGKVDFLTFRDFTINGIAVELEEYPHTFSFQKDSTLSLPRPARVFLSSKNIAKAAFKEMIESKKDWTVTGTVFVFGKFKKYGFSFKRVVPVKIDLKIKNPIG